MKKILPVLFLLSALITGCLGQKEVLKFVVIPSEDASLTKEDWKGVVEYLSDGLGRTVELVVASDYTSVIEAMKYGHANLARLSPAGYVQAIEEGAKVEPLVTAVKTSTGQPGYHSFLIARAGTDISDLNSLTFAFVDVGSTSGYIIPSIYLDKQGIEPKNVLLAGSHNAVILAVKNGSVDIGAVAENRFDVALQEGVIDEGELVIVWESDMIPNVPIVAQASLSASLKEKITALFIDMPEGIVESTRVGESGYVKASDADYDSVREVMEYEGE